MTAVNAFSYLAATHTLHVSRFPRMNYGAEVQHTHRFLAGDGPLVAGLLAASGHTATLFSNAVATDADGNDIREQLAQWQVAHAHSSVRADQTRVNTVITDQAGNRTWFSRLADIATELDGIDLDRFTQAEAAYVDCYEVLGQAPRPVMEAALDAGQDLVVNLGGGPVPPWLPATVADAARRIGVLQTNADEHDPTHREQRIQELAELDIADLVVVTAGRAGATARTATGDLLAMPAPQVRVAQVQGAGAAFSAALIHARLNGQDTAAALELACATGSLWCSRPPHQTLPTIQKHPAY